MRQLLLQLLLMLGGGLVRKYDAQGRHLACAMAGARGIANGIVAQNVVNGGHRVGPSCRFREWGWVVSVLLLLLRLLLKLL